MTYYVNLGGLILYGIKAVSDDSGREMATYNGLGQGAFALPEAAKPREWSIECEFTEQDAKIPNWSAASRLFYGFEVLLNTKNPSRFIFVSENRNMSISGYLASYSKKEEFPGVYQVTVKVVEYKAVCIKTTEVPYISRPGKAPALPKTVVFDNKTTPYTHTQKDKGIGGGGQASPGSGAGRAPLYVGGGGSASSKGGAGRGDIIDLKTGKPAKNPVLLNDEEKYAYTMTNAVVKTVQPFFQSPTIKSAFKAINGCIDNFRKTATQYPIGTNI